MQAGLTRQRGFTIVELLIVIVVIAILAAVSVVAYRTIQDRAKFARMRQDVAHLQKALEMYRSENGRYPSSTACDNVDLNFQNNWCGWRNGANNSFIPGLAPDYISKTPNLSGLGVGGTYLYKSSDATWGDNFGGGKYYELMRINTSGLTSIESDVNSNPLRWTGNGYDGIAWGVKSDPSLPNW